MVEENDNVLGIMGRKQSLAICGFVRVKMGWNAIDWFRQRELERMGIKREAVGMPLKVLTIKVP